MDPIPTPSYIYRCQVAGVDLTWVLYRGEREPAGLPRSEMISSGSPCTDMAQMFFHLGLQRFS